MHAGAVSRLRNVVVALALMLTLTAIDADEPQVIHVPAVSNRFYGIQPLTPWTENVDNVTSAPGPAGTGTLTSGGDFAVVPPGFAGALPDGATRINPSFSRVWTAERTLIRGESDTPAVNSTHRLYTITPLSRYGQPFPAPPVDPDATPTFATLPSLNADTLQGMRGAVTRGPANIATALNRLYGKNAPSHGGYLVVPARTYGATYRLRAVIDGIGSGDTHAHR